MAKTPLSSLLNQTEAISNVTDTLNEANGVVGNAKLAKALSNTDKVINTVKGVGQLANDVSAMAVGVDSVMAGLNTASQLGVGGEKVAKRLGQAQEVIRLAQKAGKMANQLPALAQSPVKAMSAMLSGQAATFPAGLQFTFQAFNLPPETFSVVEFKGEEGYSELFQFTLTLISDKPNIAFNQVLDSLGTLSIYRDGILLRSFTGMVAEFEKGETGFHKTYYTVQLRPEFWRTTLRTNSRIFQQKDLKKIVGTILTEHGISQYAYNFKDAHPIREFCVQYQETDFDFLCRLLAEEGIFFYFEFQPKQHTLIFCDNADSLVTGETISYNPNPEATRRESMIWRFKRAERVRVSSTQLRDYTFKKPGWNAQFGKQASDLDNQRQAYEYFEYPARFKQADRGKAFSQYRLDSLRNEAHQSAGESNATELVLGTRFVLKNHPDKSLNRPWQPIRLSHFGRQPQGAEAEADLQGSGTYYQNHFQFIPITQTWRPLAIPKPQVFGPQMAMVVGPKGEEIFTDKFGRVKVQFLWDRYGEGNDRSSCWIRVSQPWAGAGFGGITIPRIGQEVIVSFLEGDPDQPIIIGRTYHAENLPPGTLPKAATQTIIKSQTHKGKGSNELRMEDSNGKEELYLHAQKDMNTVVKNDQRTTVQKGNKELFVELGNQLTQIGIGFLTERIGGGRITESNMVSVKTSKAGVGEAALPGTQTYQADDEILLKVGEQTSILMNNEEIQLKFGESIVKLNANGVFVNGSKVGLNSPKAESDTGEGASAAVLSPTEEQVQDGGGGRMAHGGEIGQGGGASGQGSAGSSGGKGDKGGLGASGEMCKPPQMGQAKGNSSSDMCKPPQMGQSGNPSSPLSGGVGDVPPGAKSFMPDKRARSNKQCPRVGHPVNPVLGIKVLGEEVDFAFEGILPLSWTRSYYSDQIGTGWLGQGWSVPGVQRLVKVPAGMRYIDEQGSELALPALEPASGAVFLPEHQLWVQRTGYDDYVLQPLDRRLSFSFTGLRLQDGVHYPLTKVEDRYGNQQRFIYQPQTGLPQYMIDGNGRTFSLLFDTINEGKDTRLISIALLAKQADLSEAQKDLHRQGEVLVGYAYDEAGDLAQVIDRYGNITRTFSYRNHIMVSHRDSAGLEAYYEYDNPSLTGKVLRHHTNLGEQWQFIYHPSYTEVIDTLGRREYYYFNEHQELTGQIFADGSQSQNERDDMGRVVKQTDRNGKTTRYVYTPQGQVSKVIQPDGQETRYEYDNQGRLIRQTNGAGHTTRYEYDDKGSLIAEQQGNQRIRFRYTESGLISSMTDPLGNETRYHYNADNQLAAQTDCSDNRTEWHYTPTGQISRLIDAAGNETRYRYDNQQRLTQIDYPDGSQEQFSYDSANRLAIYTDGNGSQTEYRYALDGLPTQRINALGNVFHYQYDPARRLSALVNENQASYRFEYDEGDRLIGESGFDGKYTRYHYQNGDLVEQQVSASRNSPPLRTHYFERDSFGRLIAHKAQASESTQPDMVAEYGYDSEHRLNLARNGESELQFEYDRFGRLISQSCKTAGKTDRFQYQYDANGNRTQTRLPNGETLDYLYYGSGHLSAIKHNGTLISEFERDNLHREIQRTQGALTTRYALDPVGKLTAQLNAQIERRYQYDNAGNLAQSRDNLTQNTHYGYDKLGRLTQAKSLLSQETFAFDPAHNIIEREGQREQDNKVNQYHGTHYRYDGLGNLVERKLASGETQYYRYDLNDQLIEAKIIKANGQEAIWHYRYDPLGRRLNKRSATHENLQTDFVWDGSHLIQEQNGDNRYTYIYTHPESYEPLAQIKDNGEVAYYHCDQIGIPRELTDQQGNILWYASYKGWGELQGEHNLKGVHQPLRLQNQYADKETGLHYNFFRYYEPTVGRFTTQDPIGLAGGENLYRFGDNILNYIDPLGLFTYHGNWCGPDWTGGRTESYNKGRDYNNYYSNPISQLDAACKKHDICYSKCRETFQCSGFEKEKCMKKCDNKLVSSSKSIKKEANSSKLERKGLEIVIGMHMGVEHLPESSCPNYLDEVILRTYPYLK